MGQTDLWARRNCNYEGLDYNGFLKLFKDEDCGQKFNEITNLVNLNDYVAEYSWRDGNKNVTTVILTKFGVAWRQIANRVKIEQAD